MLNMTLPLAHITILDLTRLQPGPYCTMYLADLGANIIRIEEPNFPFNSPPPFFLKGKYRESAFNSILHRNKKSMSLNLKSEKSLEIFYKLQDKYGSLSQEVIIDVAHTLNIPPKKAYGVATFYSMLSTQTQTKKQTIRIKKREISTGLEVNTDIGKYIK